MKNKIMYILPLAMLMNSCGDDAATPAASAAAANAQEGIEAASAYVASSLPDFENSVGSSKRSDVNSRDLTIINTDRWLTLSVNPPGGVYSSEDANITYNGEDLPSTVNYRDYMKMALDKDFVRGGDNGEYKPTIFGRFDSVLEVMDILTGSNFTKDSDGLPSIGEQTADVVSDNQTITAQITVSATSDNTYYDKKIQVLAFDDADNDLEYDTGESVNSRILIWVRSTTAQLNYMEASLFDEDEDGTDDHSNLTVLNWNKTTGEMGFEYLQQTDDSNTNGNIEVFRFYVEEEDGKTWLYGLTGKGLDTDDDYFQYGIYVPSSSATEGTVSVRHFINDTDVYLGNICADFETGVGELGPSYESDEDEDESGGTCVGQVSDGLNIKAGLMGFGNDLRSDTTWKESMDEKGFDATTYYDFTDSTVLDEWLTDGESISTSFSNRIDFIDDWDGNP